MGVVIKTQGFHTDTFIYNANATICSLLWTAMAMMVIHIILYCEMREILCINHLPTGKNALSSTTNSWKALEFNLSPPHFPPIIIYLSVYLYSSFMYVSTYVYLWMYVNANRLTDFNNCFCQRTNTKETWIFRRGPWERPNGGKLQAGELSVNNSKFPSCLQLGTGLPQRGSSSEWKL